MTTKDPYKIRLLLICIVLCEGTGLLSGWISGSGNNNLWFDGIIKPTWNPPSFVFGPAWSVLYLLMSIALWLIWKSNALPALKTGAFNAFILQLFLNFCWSVIFFRFHSPGLAFADILLLWIMIIVTMFRFAAISLPAAWSLVPYISWVSFAAILNYTIWRLN